MFLRIQITLASLCTFALTLASFAKSPAPIQVYGVWHCGSDLCGWDQIRDMADFDSKNHWLIDRGDGVPSVNLVVLSFVNPVGLLNLTDDHQHVQGIPIGMSPEVISYFAQHKIRVMLSIGGFTYAHDWDAALASDPVGLGTNAARAAQRLGVGMEIDYENDHSPNLPGLQKFVDAYRAVLPYEARGRNPEARLTIYLALDDGYLGPLTEYATNHWLAVRRPVLDYANAMVGSEQATAGVFENGWREHIEGTAKVRPLAPAKLTGSLYIATRGGVATECTDFGKSLQNETGTFVKSAKPRGAGKTKGMLGYMFWAAGCPGSRAACTAPPNSCEGGIGAGAKAFNIPVPLPSLRQN
jgi:hypothetical protein